MHSKVCKSRDHLIPVTSPVIDFPIIHTQLFPGSDYFPHCLSSVGCPHQIQRRSGHTGLKICCHFTHSVFPPPIYLLVQPVPIHSPHLNQACCHSREKCMWHPTISPAQQERYPNLNTNYTICQTNEKSHALSQSSLNTFPIPQIKFEVKSGLLVDMAEKHKSFNSKRSEVDTLLHYFRRVRDLMLEYFYFADFSQDFESLDYHQLDIVKIFLIKKLVHNRQSSRLLYVISNLKASDLNSFMRGNRPLNRKNIIKSNVFKKVWKYLESKFGIHFNQHYFGKLLDRYPCDYFSMRIYRRNHCFNLTDEFYNRCFLSLTFETDFFQCINDSNFMNAILQSSISKFTANFGHWVSEIDVFVKQNADPFDRVKKLPDIKFGMSIHDLNASVALFEKVLSKSDR